MGLFECIYSNDISSIFFTVYVKVVRWLSGQRRSESINELKGPRFEPALHLFFLFLRINIEGPERPMLRGPTQLAGS